MKCLTSITLILFLLNGCSRDKGYPGSESDREALVQTSIHIRAAFARGDIPAILSYHHPDVIKALGFNKYIKGRDALDADLKNTLQNLKLNFIENHTESLFIQGETAVEMARFTIQGTPKDGGKPFLFQGRALVVYIRYKPSPTGWASIRELIQPATD
jgi:ketosteroid isomerase-like protein